MSAPQADPATERTRRVQQALLAGIAVAVLGGLALWLPAGGSRAPAPEGGIAAELAGPGTAEASWVRRSEALSGQTLMDGLSPSTPNNESAVLSGIAQRSYDAGRRRPRWSGTSRSGRGRYRAINRGRPKSHFAADHTVRHQPLRRILGLRQFVRLNH